MKNPKAEKLGFLRKLDYHSNSSNSRTATLSLMKFWMYM